MRDLVVPGRHSTTGHGLDDVVRLLRPVPLAEVERAAAAVHVVRHEPRDRRDVAVPRPRRLVRVAVEAGVLRERAGLRRVPGRLLRDLRVRVRAPVRDRLDEREQGAAPSPTQRSLRRMGASSAASKGAGIGERADRRAADYRIEAVQVTSPDVQWYSVPSLSVNDRSKRAVPDADRPTIRPVVLISNCAA